MYHLYSYHNNIFYMRTDRDPKNLMQPNNHVSDPIHKLPLFFSLFTSYFYPNKPVKFHVCMNKANYDFTEIIIPQGRVPDTPNFFSYVIPVTIFLITNLAFNCSVFTLVIFIYLFLFFIHLCYLFCHLNYLIHLI